MLERTVDIIKKYYQESKNEPVLKHLSPIDLKKHINLDIPKKWTDINKVFDELEKIVLASPRTSSNGFFNLLFGGKLMPAIMAEMITAVLNNTMHTYKSAGIHILIEKEVINFFLKKIWYPNGDWTFVPGWSLTNMIALILARNEKDPSIKEEWIWKKKIIWYTSDQAHYSTKKFTSIMWLGYQGIKIIPTDEKGKMDILLLEDTIKRDIEAGYIPFFVTATAWTTVLGAYDPIKEISKIAKKYKMRLHVDAALWWGALMSKKYKYLLEWIELSDSVSRNQHKMMNVPLLAAALLVKDSNVFYKNFSESADYLFQMDDQDLNPWNKTIQCGRRNDALKVWTALKYLWEDGYEKRINKEFSNAQYAVSIIKKDKDLELVLEPECINVCFHVRGKSAEKICEQLDNQWLIKVGYGIRKDKTFIRMVCVDPDMTKKDIQNFFDCVKSVKI